MDPARYGDPASGRLLGVSRAALALGVIALAVALGGCAVQPWVKPYEREHLADPIMSFDRQPVANMFLDHVYEVRNAARGATGATGGGCGCN
jgi:hypothetical protein